MPRTIAIVGASFAGLGVARWLEPRAENADVEVVLIDKRPYHEFHALLYEVATGAAAGRPEDCEKILASGVCINLHAYDRLLKGTHLTFRCDEVVGIDRRTRTLQLRGGDAVRYDALVLAIGAETAYYGIAGLKEHAIPLKSVRDALRIRRRMLELLDRARRGTEQKISILIGGGGATGVEFAAELANYLRTLVARGDIRSHDYEIAIVEAAPRLLAAFPERLSRMALQRLHRLGVRVLLDAAVKQVELGRAIVAPRSLKPGEEREQLLCGFAGDSCTLEADLIVWTGGIQFPSLPREAGFPCDPKGRVIVDVDLLVQGEQCVFALGDCASFTQHHLFWQKSGAGFTPSRATQPLPPIASIAVREAPVAAANALGCLDGYPLRRFRPPTLPSIVPLGGKYAGLAYRNWTWVGRGPWMLRSLVDLMYFCSALGLVIGLRMWWRGARMYVQND
ncbi:NAD(P)/FAD-dependent oxidoreductase [Candidatus Uhrbacteria bacterium]|nr:NAD(P)/FAD-dependent oxidoreductase [Candidatus Uhrbacteria bacterium]